MSNDDEVRSKLWKIIKGTKFCMLTHRHGNGRLHSQPLTTQNKDEGSALYFFVQKDGDIAKHVTSDPHVNIAYANVDDDDYVSVSGRAFISEDEALKRKLFNPIAKAWFPAGVDDPNLALLAVEMEQAEFWRAQDTKVVQLLKMVTSAVTGHPPEDIGEHQKLQRP